MQPKVFDAAMLLGALADSQALVSLEFENFYSCDVDSWVLLFPRLRFLSIITNEIAVDESISQLTSLTALRLAYWDSGGFAGREPQLQPFIEGRPCVPPSLLSLELQEFGALPAQLAATQLQRFCISTGFAGWLQEESVVRLGSLRQLTCLQLRTCGLHRVPSGVSNLLPASPSRPSKPSCPWYYLCRTCTRLISTAVLPLTVFMHSVMCLPAISVQLCLQTAAQRQYCHALLLQLTEMAKLAVLDLSMNPIRAEDNQDEFAPLAGLESLRELYLESSLGSGPGGAELDLTGLEVGTSKTFRTPLFNLRLDRSWQLTSCCAGYKAGVWTDG
jgi:hypothetical protein